MTQEQRPPTSPQQETILPLPSPQTPAPKKTTRSTTLNKPRPTAPPPTTETERRQRTKPTHSPRRNARTPRQRIKRHPLTQQNLPHRPPHRSHMRDGLEHLTFLHVPFDPASLHRNLRVSPPFFLPFLRLPSQPACRRANAETHPRNAPTARHPTPKGPDRTKDPKNERTKKPKNKKERERNKSTHKHPHCRNTSSKNGTPARMPADLPSRRASPAASPTTKPA